MRFNPITSSRHTPKPISALDGVEGYTSLPTPYQLLAQGIKPNQTAVVTNEPQQLQLDQSNQLGGACAPFKI